MKRRRASFLLLGRAPNSFASTNPLTGHCHFNNPPNMVSLPEPIWILGSAPFSRAKRAIAPEITMHSCKLGSFRVGNHFQPERTFFPAKCTSTPSVSIPSYKIERENNVNPSTSLPSNLDPNVTRTKPIWLETPPVFFMVEPISLNQCYLCRKQSDPSELFQIIIITKDRL